MDADCNVAEGKLVIKILALICSLSAPDQCIWKTVSSSDFADLTMSGCMVGMPQIAEWMRGFPDYRLKRWVCQLGNRPERKGA